jgi:hypothetical protein
MKTTSTKINQRRIPRHTQTTAEVRQRIEELKQRTVAAETPLKEFKFDRDEPLHLLPETQKDESVDEQ